MSYRTCLLPENVETIYQPLVLSMLELEWSQKELSRCKDYLSKRNLDLIHILIIDDYGVQSVTGLL